MSPLAREVKFYIDQYTPSVLRQRKGRLLSGIWGDAQIIADTIYNTLHARMTRKQALRTMHNMTSEDIEVYIAVYVLSREDGR